MYENYASLSSGKAQSSDLVSGNAGLYTLGSGMSDKANNEQWHSPLAW